LRSILVIRRIGRAERLPDTLDVIDELGGPEDRDCGSSGSIEPSGRADEDETGRDRAGCYSLTSVLGGGSRLNLTA